MAKYKFDTYGDIEIQNPKISVDHVIDYCDGTCGVIILLSLGAPNANATKINATLSGFTYDTDWTHAEVEAWVTAELPKYEIT